jgi:hypothetical protein
LTVYISSRLEGSVVHDLEDVAGCSQEMSLVEVQEAYDAVVDGNSWRYCEHAAGIVLLCLEISRISLILSVRASSIFQ